MRIPRPPIFADFLPHGYCMRWQPSLVSTHVIADVLIALAYFCIPALLWFRVRQRPDIRFNWIFITFGSFILACGMTHVMDIITLWVPLYRLSAFFKIVTASASMGTVVALYKFMPQVLHVLTPRQMQNQVEERLQMVLDGATNVSIIATDREGLITLFNRGAENILGYRSDEMVGKQTLADIHLESEVMDRALEWGKPVAGFDVLGLNILMEKARNGQHEEREWTYVRKDGSHLTVNLVVTPLYDDNGTINGFLGVAMDVTARNKAKAILRSKDERFRLIVEAVADYALIMLDASGLVADWNTGAERMKGYKASEIIGKHFSCLYPPQEIDRHHPEEELRIAEKQGRYSEEGWRVRKDGSRFLAHVVIAATRDDDGKLVGFAKVVHDLTELKKLEERFQLVVEASPSAMIMTSADGLITLVNGQTEKLFGFDRHELLGEPIEMLLPERFRRQHGSHLDELFGVPSRRAMGAGGDLFFLCKDGTEVPVELGLNPIQASSGQFVLASITDITQRRNAQREADARTAQLKAVNKELEEIVYVASHDLKAPLRVIDNASKWLEEDLGQHLTEETRGNLLLMRSRVKRMEKLLDDLLQYARIGKATDNRYGETVNGKSLVHDVMALLSTPDFPVKVDPAFSSIQVCRMPLQHILMNLVSNAIKHHNKKTGCIEITVDNKGDYYSFAVKDDGPGIPEQFHDQIFKMFQTLRPRDKVEGSGMGLAMVRKNIEVFGGALQLESAVGQGSIFRFTWPKQQRQPKAEAA